MATYYQGTRYVLKGRSTTNAIDQYTGRVGDQGNYLDLYSPDHVFDGMPDKVRSIDTWDPTFSSNARVDQAQFSSMKNAGDAAGAAPKLQVFYGVPGNQVLSGPNPWNTDAITNSNFYFGLSTAAVLPTAGITNAPGQINYYGDYIVKSPMDDPELTPSTLTTDYDQLAWKGVPSSKAL